MILRTLFCLEWAENNDSENKGGGQTENPSASLLLSLPDNSLLQLFLLLKIQFNSYLLY